MTWGFDVQQTINSLRASFNDHTLSHTQIQHWFRVFRDNPDRNTADSKRPGRPKSHRSAEGIAKVREQLEDDRCTTLRQLASKTDMSHTTMCKVLKKDLQMSKITPKFQPRILTQEQKDRRLVYSQRNLTKLDSDPGLMHRIVATDESWIYTFDPLTKCADMQWRFKEEPRPTKILHPRSAKKTMLILYFDSSGVILADFYDEGRVTREVYIESVRWMQEALRKKRPALWGPPRNFILLQDNASPHTASDTEDYFESVGQQVWEHPPCSPDLSPCDYWAFPLLKDQICGHKFDNIEDVQTAVCRTLQDIPLASFQKCFQDLSKRYRQCIALRGAYFEGSSRHGLAEPE